MWTHVLPVPVCPYANRVQLYPCITSSNMGLTTSLYTIAWSASGPKTRSNGYVLVGGRVTTPRLEMGVEVSMVIWCDLGPSEERIMGEVSWISRGERRRERMTT